MIYAQYSCIGLCLAMLIILMVHTSISQYPGTVDSSYIVQIHNERSHYAALEDKSHRKKMMTRITGQTYECFLPPTPTLMPVDKFRDDLYTYSKQDQDSGLLNQQALNFGQNALQRLSSNCLHYIDRTQKQEWVYEICLGTFIRKIRMHSDKRAPRRDAVAEENINTLKYLKTGNSNNQNTHDVMLLGKYAKDTIASILEFEDITYEKMLSNSLDKLPKVYTQVYTAQSLYEDVPNDKQEDSGTIALTKVQYLCSFAIPDRIVAGVQWDNPPNESVSRQPVAFLILSRHFCDQSSSSPAPDFHTLTVSSLLQRLVNSDVCVKRIEGWWTYELCFGKSISQYHLDPQGIITDQYSLGTFDMIENKNIITSNEALVSEYIDATHEVPRPAYLQIYTSGTKCNEYNAKTTRSSKVLYYCSQGGSNHHLLSVKETQTCSYLLKISTPLLCDHPHFINKEQKTEENAKILHCIPMDDSNLHTNEQ